MEPQPDFKAIAAQLRRPDGEAGMKTARHMGTSNRNMIQRCIDQLSAQEGHRVLEMGPGGGQHLSYLFEKAPGIHYTGIDISATMIAMAAAENKALTGDIHFMEAPVQEGIAPVPFPNGHFDRIFTVNTLYFWDDAPGQARELFRVLRPGGLLALCFATDSFMERLPFTRYGFHLYSEEKAASLMQAAGFTQDTPYRETETVWSNAGEEVQRDFVVMKLQRPA